MAFAAVLPVAGFATSTMVRGISSLYGVAGDINTWADNHILGMQKSENQTVVRTGKVMEGAKFGFGIGYIAPVTVIAVGQFLLGNTLAGVATVATAATLTNPFAMTCAAVGAIYYGWGALSNAERNDVLDKISAGLEIGIELIKSVINFIIATSKELLSSENLDATKEFVRKAATLFGRKLSDVTRAIADRVSDTAQTAKAMTASAVEATADGVKRASKAAATKTTRMADGIKNALDQNGDGQLDGDDLVHVGKRLKGAVAPTPKDKK
jgi:hypothetical protein